MKRLILISIVIGLLVLGCDSNKSTASPSFTDTPLGTTTSTPKVSQEPITTGTPAQTTISESTNEPEADVVPDAEIIVSQLTLPTLSIGDTWTEAMSVMGFNMEHTYEVIGEEMIDSKDCYIIQTLMGVPSMEIENYYDIRHVDKSTMENVRVWATGESEEISSVMESKYTYDFSGPRYPCEVGKAWEVTRTENFSMTIMEYDREPITNVETYGYEVEGIEEITVPSGTFSCLKIVKYDDSGTPLETIWQSATTKVANVKLVNHDDNETWELDSYSWSILDVSSSSTQTPTSTLLPQPSPAEPADGLVIFPDTNLEAIVRETIGKPTGEIYQSDLEGFIELRASSKNIKDLTGIEFCTSLREIWLVDNQIGDISPLANLQTLRKLFLIDNQIRDISPLASLTKLEVLFIDDNLISDISPLANLTNLNNLSLAVNRISNVTPLTEHDSLGALYLGGNPITDISPLSNLTRLTFLSLTRCRINDITALSSMVNMREIHLENNEIQDISALSDMSKVYALKLAGNRITDISPLSGLAKLVNVWLENNQVSDIYPLVLNEEFSFACGLYLQNNPLSEASINEYIPQLQRRQVEVIWE